MSTATWLLYLTLAVPVLGLLARLLTGRSWRAGVSLSLVVLAASLLLHTGLDGAEVVTLDGLAVVTPAAALGVMLLGLLFWQIDTATNPTETESVSPLVDLLLATLVAAWLTDHALVLLGLSGLALAISFVLLGWKSSWSAAGPQARQLWLSVVTSDIWLIVTVLLLVGLRGTTLDDISTPARLGAETSPATLRLIATVWLLGVAGRCGWFPFLLGHDQALQPSAQRAAWIMLALMTTGMRGFELGAGWFQSTPEATAAVSTWLVLSAVLCVWSACALEDPRRRVLYLVSANLALIGLAALNGPTATPWTLWGPAWTVLAAAATLLPSCVSAARNVSPGETGWRWSVSTAGGVRIFGTSAPAPRAEDVGNPAFDEPFSNGRNPLVFVALSGLLPWPWWWESTSSLTPGAALGVLIGQAGLAFVAASLTWQHKAELRFDRRSLIGTLIVLLPWGLTWCASLQQTGLPTRWPHDAMLWKLLALVVGVMAAGLATTPFSQGVRAACRPFLRAGEQRFSLGTLAYLMFNLPSRGLAQLVRFLDRFVIDTVVLGLLRHGPAWAAEESRQLQSAGPGFYALSLGLASTMLVFTLLWMSR